MSRQLPAPQAPEEQRRILAAARDGDEAARNALTGFFRVEIEAHVARRMGSRLARFCTAEDIAQEALANTVRALSALDTGAGFDDFRALLKRRANWVLQDRGRQAHKFIAESVVHPQAGGAAPEAANPAPSQGPVTQADEARWLRERVSTLDAKYAAVLERYLDGASFSDIAEELGIGIEAARKRYTRGVQLLKRGPGERSRESS